MINSINEVLQSRKLLRFMSALTWLTGALFLLAILIPHDTADAAQRGRQAVESFATSLIAYQAISSRQGAARHRKFDWTGFSLWILTVYFFGVWRGLTAPRWQLLLSLTAYVFVRWQCWKHRRADESPEQVSSAPMS